MTSSKAVGLSYLINNDKLGKIQKLLDTTKWDAFDMWICNVARLKVGTAEKIYTFSRYPKTYVL